MKRIIAIILTIISLALLSGCGLVEKLLPEYETEYFRYAVRTEGNEKLAYIIGFTDLGKEQTELIFPNQIDGVEVVGIGYLQHHPFTGHKQIGNFYHEKLEKLYFPFAYEKNDWEDYTDSLPNVSLVKWHESTVPSVLLSHKSIIYGYNLYDKSLRDHEFLVNTYLIGNVTYLYNYDGSPNDGYYWIDSYNESVISFIPPEPERDGYVFGGWYKEAECITPWDFENDMTGKELPIYANGRDPYDSYEGTSLYAKWVKS